MTRNSKKTIAQDFLETLISEAKKEDVSAKYIIRLLEEKDVIVDENMKSLLKKELD
ncbi:hypothetical protein N9W34_03460 [Rickettsiales bacterium]|nr:hypothetical protein [Rickettsiales bacterium]